MRDKLAKCLTAYVLELFWRNKPLIDFQIKFYSLHLSLLLEHSVHICHDLSQVKDRLLQDKDPVPHQPQIKQIFHERLQELELDLHQPAIGHSLRDSINRYRRLAQYLNDNPYKEDALADWSAHLMTDGRTERLTVPSGLNLLLLFLPQQFLLELLSVITEDQCDRRAAMVSLLLDLHLDVSVFELEVLHAVISLITVTGLLNLDFSIR